MWIKLKKQPENCRFAHNKVYIKSEQQNTYCTNLMVPGTVPYEKQNNPYPPSHNHGIATWGPPIVVRWQILSFWASMIMGSKVWHLLPFNTGKYLEQKNLKLTEPKKCKLYLVCGLNPSEKYARQNGFIFPKFRGENHKYLKPPPSDLFSSTKNKMSSPQKTLKRLKTCVAEWGIHTFVLVGKMFPAKVGPY